MTLILYRMPFHTHYPPTSMTACTYAHNNPLSLARTTQLLPCQPFNLPIPFFQSVCDLPLASSIAIRSIAAFFFRLQPSTLMSVVFYTTLIRGLRGHSGYFVSRGGAHPNYRLHRLLRRGRSNTSLPLPSSFPFPSK
ncbi:unnamed protein product, partial [Ectocarpus sp. 12 AP-2014]